MGDQYDISPATACGKVKGFLRGIPSNLTITKDCCDSSKFNGYLEFDGKYVAVRGYRDKIPLLWGIDYATHDIPHFILAPSENYIACLTYFQQLESIGYNLKLLICDGNPAMKMAAEQVFSNVLVQTCTKHYRENIKKDLAIRSSDKYRVVYSKIDHIFKERPDPVTFAWMIAKLYEDLEELNLKEDDKCLYWIGDILRRRDILTSHHYFDNAPDTTNLIEAYNSHLQGRLNTIKGFQSYHYAKRWLNGYILRRRLKNFTDCGKRFKHLNGLCSLEKTLKGDCKLPTVF